MPLGLGGGELLIILLILVVVFGATKLPQLGDGLGRAIKNFKRAVNTGNEIEVAPRKAEIEGGEKAKDATIASDEKQPVAKT